MADVQLIARGRQLFEQRAWSEAYRLLEAYDGETPLDPEDLERLATAAFLIGRDEESEAFRARAHQIFLSRGDMEGAAGSSYVTVPAIFYGKEKSSAEYRRDADVILRRVNDVPGSTEAQRRWHIERVEWKAPA